MQHKTEQKRLEILDNMCQIERLRQGIISEQYYGTGDNRRGPYYVLQGYADGKHWSKRIPRDQIEQVKADLQAGAHFKELCQQFADVTEADTLMGDESVRKKNSSKQSRNTTSKPKYSSRQ
ncbi:MAG: hypothetical protein EOM12_14175 [Verrucomicrobiae bacterium]|nr:hypothetical protein [Verrucomicrobiae bacterium]